MCSRCVNPSFQNQCTLILLCPLFQPPGEDQRNGKQDCHLLPHCFRITLNGASSNISRDSTGLSFLHINFIFSLTCISQHDCEKYLNLWSSDKWKRNLQVKKLKVDISTTFRQNSFAGLYHHPKAEINYSFPKLRGRTKKPVSKYISLSQLF